MIEHKDRYITSWMVASHLLEYYKIDVSKMSGQQVIDVLFGDIYDSGSFAIVDKYHGGGCEMVSPIKPPLGVP